MKTNRSKRQMTFGDVIANYCGTHGKQRAGGLLRLLIKAELAGFDRRNREVPGRRNGKA